jgi:hypothetical protein
VTRAFYLDWLLDGISSAPVTVQPATEESAVRDEPWYRPCPESVPDTRFSLTRDEVADAEDAVLDDLAALMAAQGLSPWAAADRLFNQIGSGGADVAGVASGGDGPGSGPGSPLTLPGADQLPV